MGQDLSKACGLISVVLGVLWCSAVGAAPPSDDTSLKARFEVDTARAGSAAKVLGRRIEERGNLVLRREEVLPGDSGDPLLTVSIHEVTGDDPGYEIRFQLTNPGTSSEDEPTVIPCELCTESEVVARTEAEIGAQVPRLRELAAATQAEDPSSGKPATPPDTSTSPPPVDEGSRGRSLRIGGGVMLGAGVVTLGAGVALALRKDTVDADNPLELVSTHPPGYALLGVGGALLIGGAVATALGVKKNREDLTLTPCVAPTFVGAAARWSF